MAAVYVGCGEALVRVKGFLEWVLDLPVMAWFAIIVVIAVSCSSIALDMEKKQEARKAKVWAEEWRKAGQNGSRFTR